MSVVEQRVVCRRLQKAQQDSPAVSQRFPLEGASFLLCLPAASGSALTFHWKLLVSQWSSLTVGNGLKGGEASAEH